MPVEAIHLSALLDSLQAFPGRKLDDQQRNLARLGAVAIDFPYFDRFVVGVVRYLLKQPTAMSSWGNLFHEQRPVGVCKVLLRKARSLREQVSTRAAGERVLAFALGYVSHVAVDRSLHPMVNRLAALRAARLNDSASRQHTEVEKFQSVLFHEQRLGFDFMGRKELREHIAVAPHVLHRDDDLRTAYLTALSEAIGEAPARSLLARWAGGYSQYTALVSSPLGKTLVPERVKHEVRAEVFEGPAISFAADYAAAVGRSGSAMAVALAFCEGGQGAEAAFDLELPEGPIDGS